MTPFRFGLLLEGARGRGLPPLLGARLDEAEKLFSGGDRAAAETLLLSVRALGWVRPLPGGEGYRFSVARDEAGLGLLPLPPVELSRLLPGHTFHLCVKGGRDERARDCQWWGEALAAGEAP